MDPEHTRQVNSELVFKNNKQLMRHHGWPNGNHQNFYCFSIRDGVREIGLVVGCHSKNLSWFYCLPKQQYAASGSHPRLMDEPGVVSALIRSYRAAQGGPLRFTPNSSESRRASFRNRSKSVAMN